MTPIDKLREAYQIGGVQRVFAEVWGRATRHSMVSPLIESLLGDVLHEKVCMFPQVGYWPEIREPRSFQEKIAYRKLFTEENLFSTISDKVKVRQYVKRKGFEDILNEIYLVADSPATISFESLPEEFVIKANHGSSMISIVRNKYEADIGAIKSRCKEWLSTTKGNGSKEYWYKKINKKVLVENLLEGVKYDIPLDYKFFVFDGEVKLIEVDFDRFSDHTRRFFDTDWNPQEFTYHYPLGPTIDRPSQLDEMIEIAEKLGEDFDFVRVDIYHTDRGIVFGEMTLAPEAGSGRFSPIQVDFEIGSHWDLERAR